MGRSRTGLLIMDASVLIDLCEADRTLIRIISDHVGQVHVPLPVLREEVEQIDESEYTELGIVPVDPPLQTAIDAAGRRAGLSFHDHLCLLLARDNGWTCVTNDGRLRREVKPSMSLCSGVSRRSRSSWTPACSPRRLQKRSAAQFKLPI